MPKSSIQRQLFQRGDVEADGAIRSQAANHPLRTKLLKIPLLPYHLGIAFAAGTGRAVLADDMGLWDTIEGVGAVEKRLPARPASARCSWFARRRSSPSGGTKSSGSATASVQLVVGGAAQWAGTYDNDAFFTVCNYVQVLRDILAVEGTRGDLIILDEGELRIKNWQSKTWRMIKALKLSLCPRPQRHAAGKPAGRTP